MEVDETQPATESQVRVSLGSGDREGATSASPASPSSTLPSSASQAAVLGQHGTASP